MGLHASTFPMLTALLAQMSGATQPIEVILDVNVKRKMEENRDKLASITNAVLHCGRLGLPLRGHRDESSMYPKQENPNRARKVAKKGFNTLVNIRGLLVRPIGRTVN